jgi:3-oxoadipate enol-lactonase
MQVNVNGIETRYVLDSAGSANPWITFIHPLGADLSVWDQLTGHFRASHNVLRYDVRGHGHTALSPNAFSVADLADDLGAMLGTLGVETTDIVGMSLGGMIGQEFALRHPQKLRNLVLADTTSRYGPEQRAGWVERAGRARREGMAALQDETLARWFTEPFRKKHPEAIEQIAEVFLGTDPVGYAAACFALSEFDVQARLPEIAAPTLVVVGEQDSGTPVALAKVIAQSIPGARLEVMEGAHFAPVEEPARFVACLEAFLQENSR